MPAPTVEQALIVLTPPSGGWRWLLEKPMAGVTPLERLIFSLGRAGIERIGVLCHEMKPSVRDDLQRRFENEKRNRAEVTFVDAEDFKRAEDRSNCRFYDQTQPALWIPGNWVTTQHTIRDFLQSTREAKMPVLLVSASGETSMTLILPDCIDHFEGNLAEVLNETFVETVDVGPSGFLGQVKDAISFRKVEQALLTHHRRHYTQLLDVHFNAYFSIPISSWLVRMPVTPNQLTLSGLLIGLASGWLFAQGDYWSGLAGGLLLAFTAIWDCCDGDVARLKFMESDFGATLDTTCDNIINVFLFTGLAFGAAKLHGWSYALMPFLLLILGGVSIFCLIYFPEGDKGDFFKKTALYDVILLLASRNFIYVILGFSLFGALDQFLWLAGFGSVVFAGVLFFVKQRIAVQSKE